MNNNKKSFISILGVVILLSLIYVLIIDKQTTKVFEENIAFKQDLIVPTIEKTDVVAVQPKRYDVKEFSIVMGSKRLSNKQIKEHKELYAGYVNKRNEIDKGLQTADRTKGNSAYSLFRALKVSETFARNGALLHELYFENIATETTIGMKTQEAIVSNFGSLAAFKEDLMATALSARGWALTCYNLDDQRIQNYLLDAHNQTVPVLTIPLLVIDTYEHAYMIDFGINRKEYLAVLWDNINWNIVEERLNKCIHMVR